MDTKSQVFWDGETGWWGGGGGGGGGVGGQSILSLPHDLTHIMSTTIMKTVFQLLILPLSFLSAKTKGIS